MQCWEVLAETSCFSCAEVLCWVLSCPSPVFLCSCSDCKTWFVSICLLVNGETALDKKYYLPPPPPSKWRMWILALIFTSDSIVLEAAGVCLQDLLIESLKITITCCSLISHLCSCIKCMRLHGFESHGTSSGMRDLLCCLLESVLLAAVWGYCFCFQAEMEYQSCEKL